MTVRTLARQHSGIASRSAYFMWTMNCFRLVFGSSTWLRSELGHMIVAPWSCPNLQLHYLASVKILCTVRTGQIYKRQPPIYDAEHQSQIVGHPRRTFAVRTGIT